MSSKGQLKREIKKCRLTIEEIERKRSRSQSALVQAILCRKSLTKWTLSGSTNTQAR